jgi:CheY-like chemotaxis protein
VRSSAIIIGADSMNTATTTIFRATTSRARRVLLACANAVERDYLERRLERAGYMVESTATLDGCGEILVGVLVDALVVAADLPDALGVQAVRRLRRDQRLRSIPLIWLAGSTPSSQIVQALEADADEVLRGGIDPDDLIARLGRWARRRAEEQRVAGERSYVLAGDFSVFSFPDLVAFLHGQRRTGALGIVTTSGFGTVFFREGDVISVAYGNLFDFDAFDELFRAGHGHFEFRPDHAEALPPATINCSTTALLLDAARGLDDARAVTAKTESTSTRSSRSMRAISQTAAGGNNRMMRRDRLSPSAWQAMAEACAMELNVAEFRPLSQRAFRTELTASAADARVARWVVAAAGTDALAIAAGLAPTVSTTDVMPLVGSVVVGGVTTLTVDHPLVGTIEVLHVPLERIAALAHQIPPYPDAVIVMPAHGDMLTTPIDTRMALAEALSRINGDVIVGMGNTSVAQGLRHLLEIVGWRGIHLHLDDGDLSVSDPRRWMSALCTGVAQRFADTTPHVGGTSHVAV